MFPRGNIILIVNRRLSTINFITNNMIRKMLPKDIPSPTRIREVKRETKISLRVRNNVRILIFSNLQICDSIIPREPSIITISNNLLNFHNSFPCIEWVTFVTYSRHQLRATMVLSSQNHHPKFLNLSQPYPKQALSYLVEVSNSTY